MAKTSAIITYTDSDGKAMQKTLADINPEASSTELVTFAQKMVGMTDNVYVQTDRVDKINCDTEASAAVKATPTITLNETTITCADLVAAVTTDTMSHRKSFTFTHNSDAVPYAYITNNTAVFGVSAHSDNGTNKVFITTGTDFNNLPGFSYSGEVVVCLPETDNFKAAQAVFTITA